jgi:hypothetical protein
MTTMPRRHGVFLTIFCLQNLSGHTAPSASEWFFYHYFFFLPSRGASI